MKRFAIVYGGAEHPLEKRAIEELSSVLLEYTAEYPVTVRFGEDFCLSDYKCIYIGTKETNPYIAKNSERVLTKKEEYYIKVSKSTAIIEGYDAAGTLYGVLDFYNKYVVKFEHPDTDEYWKNFLICDTLPSFECSSAPAISDRGLWTWGHVLYDYRGYFDNMMRLKLNRVVIWNDFLPLNASDIVAYAHERNIKVIWGFPWLWDTDCNKFDLSALSGESERIFSDFEKNYADAAPDGIYFQTFTELRSDNIGGVIIAEAASKFVNATAALFLEKYPDMEIQFGLHASSVKDHLDFISKVDPRIRIVWEDCGATPFSYIPRDLDSFDETKAFVRKIANLRGTGDRFGVVTKGLVKLDWSEFEHPRGVQYIGVSSDAFGKNRAERKRRIWRYIQACWIAHSDAVREMINLMRELKGGDLYALALVEDGMFEREIMYPVALFSEMLWDADAPISEIINEVALRSYVVFA